MHCLIKKIYLTVQITPLILSEFIYRCMGGGFQVLFLKIFETHIMLKVNK